MGLLQKTKELGATLIAFSPVGRSILTDNPLEFDVCSALPFMKVNPRFQEANYDRNIQLTNNLRSLAADMGVSTSGLAIAWLLAQGEHVVPIPGTRSIDHLNELAAGADLDLTSSDIEAIEIGLPIGWCHGDRYSDDQWQGPVRYC